MLSWQEVWRVSTKYLPTEGLEALAKALKEDDPRLLQGVTTSPPPLQCVQDWPVEAACAWGFCGWQGQGQKVQTVGEVEEFFARTSFEVDNELGSAQSRWFLSWFDETPRDDMRNELLPEVLLELDRRERLENDNSTGQIRSSEEGSVQHAMDSN